MARIAFCWELGQGFGHLAPHLELIGHLTAHGDEVFFLAKETRTALEVFDRLLVEVIDLIPGITPPAERIVGADSYPEVLHNCGFHAPDLLHQRDALVAMIEDIDRVVRR